MDRQRWNRCVDNDRAEIADKHINRIEQKQFLYFLRIFADIIKDRRHIHEKSCQNIVKILDVSEKDIQGRQDHTCADIKQHQAEDRIEQQKKFPGKGQAIKRNKEEKDHKDQQKVDKRLHIFGKQEEIFRNIDLCKDTRISHNRAHSALGRFAEISKNQVTAEKIDGKVWS